jgi:hypothetical protein
VIHCKPSIKFHKKDYILRITPTLTLPPQGGGNNYEDSSTSPPLVGGDRGEGEVIKYKENYEMLY